MGEVHDIQQIPKHVYPYDLVPLLEHDSIRLLVLEAAGKDEIKCSLIHTTLSECDSNFTDHFIALSYVWGSTTFSKVIWVDNKPVSVTANLFDALRDIRHDTARLILWVDALCINQQDRGEKEHQVPMMLKIYASAFRTIIYLGNLTLEEDLDLMIQESQSHKGLRLELCSTILAHPWFRRVWVFQEFISSRDPWIQYGTKRVRWNVFYAFISKNLTPDSAYPGSEMQSRGRSDFLQDSAIYKLSKRARTGYDLFLHMQNARTSMRKCDSIVRTPLFDLLSPRSGLEATDPRDLVFAHSGIASNGSHPSLAVDYSKSYIQVYEDFARYQIEETNSFRIFSYINHASLNRLKGLATWAPDWTTTPMAYKLDSIFQLRAMGDTKDFSYSSFHPDQDRFDKGCVAYLGKSTISCVANFVGAVTHISTPLSGTLIKHSERERFMSELASLLQREWDWDSLAQEFLSLCEEIYNAWREVIKNDMILPPISNIIIKDYYLVEKEPSSDDPWGRCVLFNSPDRLWWLAHSIFGEKTHPDQHPPISSVGLASRPSTADILIKYFLPGFDKDMVDGKILVLSTLLGHHLMLGSAATQVGDGVFIPCPPDIHHPYYVMRPLLKTPSVDDLSGKAKEILKDVWQHPHNFFDGLENSIDYMDTLSCSIVGEILATSLQPTYDRPYAMFPDYNVKDGDIDSIEGPLMDKVKQMTREYVANLQMEAKLANSLIREDVVYSDKGMRVLRNSLWETPTRGYVLIID